MVSPTGKGFRQILTIAGLVAFGVGKAYANVPNRPATLEDAQRVASVGRIAVRPNGSAIAIEQSGKIVVISTNKPAVILRTLEGTEPAWSPDGRLLAFYVVSAGKTQLGVLNIDEGATRTITDLPDGISPDPLAMMGYYRWFSWSPDSKRIAFVSRLMPGYETIANSSDNARVTVHTERDNSRSAALAGVLHGKDVWDQMETWGSDFSAARFRAVEKRPEFRLNHLFIVDVRTHTTRLIDTKLKPFYPSWSPDGTRLALITETVAAELGWGSLQTALAIIDIGSGTEMVVPTPMYFNGVPRWSSDGNRVSLIAQRRRIGFAHIMNFSVRENRWSEVATPGGKSAITDEQMVWSRRSNVLTYVVADRLHESVWEFDPSNGRTRQVDTRGWQVNGVDQDNSGRIFVNASGPTFAGRIYVLSGPTATRASLIYDANPQLSEIRFGEQRSLTWKNSVGDEVDGVAILPPDYSPDRRYPVIVDVYPKRRAGNGFKLAATSQYMGQLAAARGYVVFLPSLREPHGTFAFSQDEAYTEKARGVPGIHIMVDDLESGLRYLTALGLIDPERVGLFGHSNGGYAVNLLITESNVGQCAAISAGLSNFLNPVMGADPPGFKEERTNGNLYDNFDDYARMSPLFRMDRVHIPILMFSGDKDWDWTLQMAAQFGSLRLLGKPVTWVRYRDEGHYFEDPADVKDSFERLMQFFGEHLRMPENPPHLGTG
jgi:dipeptidyl aminopeptidase/acylaminoacyl peptidase